MPSVAEKTQAITDTINRYIHLLGSGSADEIAQLYADDATVEDPVGVAVFNGRQAIRDLYSPIENGERECELVSVRVSGNQAAFQFRLTYTADEGPMQMEPIDVMVFDDNGKVATMKAFYSAAELIVRRIMNPAGL